MLTAHRRVEMPCCLPTGLCLPAGVYLGNIISIIMQGPKGHITSISIVNIIRIVIKGP